MVIFAVIVAVTTIGGAIYVIHKAWISKDDD